MFNGRPLAALGPPTENTGWKPVPRKQEPPASCRCHKMEKKSRLEAGTTTDSTSRGCRCHLDNTSHTTGCLKQPRVFLRDFRQACGDGVIPDVVPGFFQFPFVSNNPIVPFVLPQWTGLSLSFVDHIRRVTLDTVEQFSQRIDAGIRITRNWEWASDRVDMVGHHNSDQNLPSLAVPEPNCVQRQSPIIRFEKATRDHPPTKGVNTSRLLPVGQVSPGCCEDSDGRHG